MILSSQIPTECPSIDFSEGDIAMMAVSDGSEYGSGDRICFDQQKPKPIQPSLPHIPQPQTRPKAEPKPYSRPDSPGADPGRWKVPTPGRPGPRPR